ncbi:MAG TPA: CBS domain-containing protein [Fibrobacteria bacterium]|nr:CBS domain-containing protein [Fibrobacteria bacterium]
MNVKEIMTENPICCTAATSLEEVARMMVENDCGAIPVVEDQEGWKPIGIITDRDITTRAVAEGRNPLELSAGDIMTPSPVTVGPDTAVEECESLMETHQLRRILVVDSDGGCCGIVSLADIARNAPESHTAEVVEEVSKPAGGGL